MKALLAPLEELADYEEIRKNRTKENGMIQIAGCVNTQKIHLICGLGNGCEYKLVIFADEEKAKNICCSGKQCICIRQGICFFTMQILKGKRSLQRGWKF